MDIDVEVTDSLLCSGLGKKVEAFAFGMSYVGILTQVDTEKGNVRIEDGEDYVILEIERIESFRIF